MTSLISIRHNYMHDGEGAEERGKRGGGGLEEGWREGRIFRAAQGSAGAAHH